jgi:hypothetical protein
VVFWPTLTFYGELLLRRREDKNGKTFSHRVRALPLLRVGHKKWEIVPGSEVKHLDYAESTHHSAISQRTYHGDTESRRIAGLCKYPLVLFRVSVPPWWMLPWLNAEKPSYK